MKGTVFIKPLEYQFITEGEEWKQGGEVKGTLLVKNHGTEAYRFAKLSTLLAYADFKDVRAKKPDAWEQVTQQVLAENIEIASQEQKEFKWKIQLAEDCPITDSTSSLYLLYGDMTDLGKCGNLQLNIDLRPKLYYFLQTFVDIFRFKVSQKKSKKGVVEIKLVPPNSREFGNIDNVVCQLKLVNDVMEIRYSITTKSLGMNEAGEAKFQKAKQEFFQELNKEQYELYGHAPNPDGLKKAIGSILQQVAPKMLF